MCRVGNTCICPPNWEWDEMPESFQPVLKTPLDKIGFAWKCCYCIPLRIASMIVCFISFVWSCVQMSTAPKLMGRIFEDATALYWSKLIYTMVAFTMVIASGLLLVGIIMSSYKLLNFYVWFALVYNIIYIVVVMVGTASSVAESGHMPGRKTMKLILTMFWTFLFFYFIMVVNSYRITLWAF